MLLGEMLVVRQGSGDFLWLRLRILGKGMLIFVGFRLGPRIECHERRWLKIAVELVVDDVVAGDRRKRHEEGGVFPGATVRMEVPIDMMSR